MSSFLDKTVGYMKYWLPKEVQPEVGLIASILSVKTLESAQSTEHLIRQLLSGGKYNRYLITLVILVLALQDPVAATLL